MSWKVFTWAPGGLRAPLLPLTTPLGRPFPLNGTPPGLRGRSRSLAMRTADSSSSGSRTTRDPRPALAADGTPLGGNFQVSTLTPTELTNPQVASDPSGNFVVTWTRSRTAWLARRSTATALHSTTSSSRGLHDRIQNATGVAMSPTDFVVTWSGAGRTDVGPFARRFDAVRTPITSTSGQYLRRAPGDPAGRRHERRRRFRRRVARLPTTIFMTSFGPAFQGDGDSSRRPIPVRRRTASAADLTSRRTGPATSSSPGRIGDGRRQQRRRPLL